MRPSKIGLFARAQLPDYMTNAPVNTWTSFTSTFVNVTYTNNGPYSQGIDLKVYNNFKICALSQASTSIGIIDMVTGVKTTFTGPTTFTEPTIIPFNNDTKALCVSGGSGTASAYTVDLNTGQFTNLSLPDTSKRTCHASYLPDGRILIFGGDTSTAYTYSAGSLTAITSMPQGANRFSAAATSGNRVFSFGGYSNVNAVTYYDSVANTWTSATTMPGNRYGACATTLNDGNILIFGGNQGTNTDVYLCDTTTVTTTLKTTINNARPNGTSGVVLSATGNLLMFSDGAVTEVYNGTNFTNSSSKILTGGSGGFATATTGGYQYIYSLVGTSIELLKVTA